MYLAVDYLFVSSPTCHQDRKTGWTGAERQIQVTRALDLHVICIHVRATTVTLNEVDQCSGVQDEKEAKDGHLRYSKLNCWR